MGASALQDLAHLRPALVGLGGQAAHENFADPRRHGGGVAGGLADRALEHADQQFGSRSAGEGPLAVQRLVQRDTKRELIAAGVGALTLMLLGRHVGRRAHDGADLGEARRQLGGPLRHVDDLELGARRLARHRRVAGLDRFVVQLLQIGQGRRLVGGLLVGVGAGQAKVEHADPAVPSDEHVLGLEVAVNDAGLMRRRQPATGVEVDREDLLPGARGFDEPGRQVHAIDELHRDEHLLGVGAHVVHRDDRGVRELGERLRLAKQAGLGDLGTLGEVARVEQLERDPPVQLGVERGVHDAHAAPRRASPTRRSDRPQRRAAAPWSGECAPGACPRPPAWSS